MRKSCSLKYDEQLPRTKKRDRRDIPSHQSLRRSVWGGGVVEGECARGFFGGSHTARLATLFSAVFLVPRHAGPVHRTTYLHWVLCKKTASDEAITRQWLLEPFSMWSVRDHPSGVYPLGTNLSLKHLHTTAGGKAQHKAADGPQQDNILSRIWGPIPTPTPGPGGGSFFSRGIISCSVSAANLVVTPSIAKSSATLHNVILQVRFAFAAGANGNFPKKAEGEGLGMRRGQTLSPRG